MVEEEIELKQKLVEVRQKEWNKWEKLSLIEFDQELNNYKCFYEKYKNDKFKKYIVEAKIKRAKRLYKKRMEQKGTNLFFQMQKFWKESRTIERYNLSNYQKMCKKYPKTDNGYDIFLTDNGPMLSKTYLEDRLFIYTVFVEEVDEKFFFQPWLNYKNERKLACEIFSKHLLKKSKNEMNLSNKILEFLF